MNQPEDNAHRLSRARAELASIVSTLATVPDTDRTRRTAIMPLNEAYVGPAMQPVPMMKAPLVLWSA